MGTNSNYIPALNRHWLTPLYDPFMRLTMREISFKQRIIDLAAPQPGERILDLGCGTGTLTLMIQQAQPQAWITGVDGDQDVLAIARQKAAHQGYPSVQWDLGVAEELPYPNDSFDLVVSSLVIHHLTPDKKQQAFREVYRVLVPGGRFYIGDFGPPHDPLMKLVTVWMSRLEQTAGNFKGEIPVYLRQMGFRKVVEVGYMRSIFGPLSFYQALRPHLAG